MNFESSLGKLTWTCLSKCSSFLHHSSLIIYATIAKARKLLHKLTLHHVVYQATNIKKSLAMAMCACEACTHTNIWQIISTKQRKGDQSVSITSCLTWESISRVALATIHRSLSLKKTSFSEIICYLLNTLSHTLKRC